MPKRWPMGANPSRSVSICVSPATWSNTTRMKKRSDSVSSNCWASRMLQPASNRYVDTAATMPGRLGQDSLRTKDGFDIWHLKRRVHEGRAVAISAAMREALDRALPPHFEHSDTRERWNDMRSEHCRRDGR